MHAPVVAGSDYEQLRRVSYDGLKVFSCETVPLPAPPAFLDMIGKDDDVGVVFAAADADTAESVMVDFNGSKVISVYGVMAGPGNELPISIF